MNFKPHVDSAKAMKKDYPNDFRPYAILVTNKDRELFPLVLDLDTEEMKRRSMWSLGAAVKTRSDWIEEVYVIFDALVRKVHEKEFKKTLENYDTEQPSTYPPSMRSEALILLNFELKPFRMNMLTAPYEKKGKKLVFTEGLLNEDIPLDNGQLTEFFKKGFDEWDKSKSEALGKMGKC